MIWKLYGAIVFFNESSTLSGPWGMTTLHANSSTLFNFTCRLSSSSFLSSSESLAMIVPITSSSISTTGNTNVKSFRSQAIQFCKKRMPILQWLPAYNIRRDLKDDLIAGFTVGVMLVPQEMSFSALMGVPAQYGLYTATIAPMLYPLFGSSRALAVANTAEGSLLVGVILRSLDIKSMEERIATGILLTFFTGILMIIGGLAKLGGVVSFFSRTSMHGYVTATAFLIIISQLPSWLGIHLKEGSNLTFFSLIEIAAEIPNTNWYSFMLGVLSLFVLSMTKFFKLQLQKMRVVKPFERNKSKKNDQTAIIQVTTTEMDDEEDQENMMEIHLTAGAPLISSEAPPSPDSSTSSSSSTDTDLDDIDLEKEVTSNTTSKRAPCAFLPSQTFLFKRVQDPQVAFGLRLLCDAGAFVVCIIGMFFGAALGPENIQLTGKIHNGLPTPGIPIASIGALIPTERLQTIILNAMTIACVFFMSSMATANKLASQGGYEVSPNQELLGLGFSNLGASFFQGMPSSGGMSRSAVNAQCARTPLASMITAVLVSFTIVFLTGPLYYLPKAPLVAIILMAAITLIDFSEPKWLRQFKRVEFYVWVAAFGGTLVFGLLQGLLFSIAASAIGIMAQTKRPVVTTLGRSIDGTFVDVSIDPKAQEVQDVLVVRTEQTLYFANCAHVIHAIERKLEERKEKSRILGVVLDGARINDIDATSMHLLHEFQLKLAKNDQKIVFANLRHDTAATLVKSKSICYTNHNNTRKTDHEDIEDEALIAALSNDVAFAIDTLL